MNRITEVKHIANRYEVTDHYTLMLKIDFNKAEGGKCVFRCLLALHKDVDYQRLIRNAIKIILLSNVIRNPITKIELANVTTRIAMEEEIKEETTLDWQTNDRLIALRYTVATLLSNEPINEVIINREMAVSKSTLLEMVLMMMKEETITFTKRIKKNQKEKP